MELPNNSYPVVRLRTVSLRFAGRREAIFRSTVLGEAIAWPADRCPEPGSIRGGLCRSGSFLGSGSRNPDRPKRPLLANRDALHGCGIAIEQDGEMEFYPAFDSLDKCLDFPTF